MFAPTAADLAPQRLAADVVCRTVVVGRLQCNCTVLGNRRTKEAREAPRRARLATRAAGGAQMAAPAAQASGTKDKTARGTGGVEAEGVGGG